MSHCITRSLTRRKHGRVGCALAGESDPPVYTERTTSITKVKAIDARIGARVRGAKWRRQFAAPDACDLSAD
jgi:hypothetical protein